MMSDRHPVDDFESTVRRALDDVSVATRPDADLADRLIANTRAGGPTVVRLDTRRRPTRWMMPLLAAAAIVALAAGATVGVTLLSERSHDRPAHRPSPIHTTPSVPTPPVVAHFRAQDLYFADHNHGMAIGDGQCASSQGTDCPALIATSDGGHSWQDLHVPTGLVSTFDSGSCGSNGNLAGPCVDHVLFASESDIYLWSLHETYWSTDGGRNWSRYVNPDTDWDGAAQMVTVGNSVIRLASPHQCSSGCAGAVEVAPLGTADFEPVTVSSKEVGLYSSTFGVACCNNTAYLFAGGTASNDGVGVLRSTDGGHTWQSVNPDPCADPQASFFAAQDLVAADGALVASCGSGLRAAAPGSAQFSALRPYPHGQIVWSVTTSSAQMITAADVSKAYGSGPFSTTFYVTTDGGLTWQRGATMPVRGGAFTFTDGYGYAAASNASLLYVTHDGGRTWTQQAFS